MEALIDYISRVWSYNLWQVAAEFILIGFIVFWVVDFLEGTRGERLFRSVIFILIAGVLLLKIVVERPGFERLRFLYGGFLVGVLIIATIAFQPEIRRALIRIGQPRFTSGAPHRVSKIIEAILAAVTELSAARTGAIIVIEKRVALGEFVETGVQLDAKITAELLKTIFYPGTALHDMAVIIRDDRIIAARVQLPLAEGGSKDGFELGSRHRAAIGITESSDAAVIVVSEETGAISIAQGGELTRNISKSRLRDELVGAVEQPASFINRLDKFTGKAAGKNGGEEA